MTDAVPPERIFPTSKVDAQSAKHVPSSPQTESDAYKLAFQDTDFLLRPDLRPGAGAPDPAGHPRAQIAVGPDEVLAAGLPPGRGRAVGHHLGHEAVREAQGVQGLDRDPVVAQGREVQPVGVPHRRVRELPQPPQVHQDGVVPGRDHAHVLVVDRDPAPDPAQHGRGADVRAADQHDRRPVRREPAHDVVHLLGGDGGLLRPAFGSQETSRDPLAADYDEELAPLLLWGLMSR